MKNTKKAVLLIILSSIFAGTGQLLWKKASFDLSLDLISLLNPFLILGVIVYITATFLMTLAFKEGEFSVLMPFLSLSFIWVILVSTMIFPTETLNMTRVIAIIIVFFGVSLVGIGGKK